MDQPDWSEQEEQEEDKKSSLGKKTRRSLLESYKSTTDPFFQGFWLGAKNYPRKGEEEDKTSQARVAAAEAALAFRGLYT